MLNRLMEAISCEEQAVEETQQKADGVMLGSNIDTYKRLVTVQDGETLSDEDKQDLTNTLNSVKLESDMSKEEQLQAVLAAAK